MKKIFGLLSVLTVLIFSPPAPAGEIITFINNDKGERMLVIPKASLRALIAEFLDPAGTGIGQSLGYLMWRETLTAISDQSGAGVILARAPEGQNLTELIGDRYHLAAKEIAVFQKAAMMLWGAVIENPGGDLTINTHLTLLPDALKTDGLVLRYSVRRQPGDGLKAAITRTKFNFSAVTRNRKDLFDRKIITRSTSNIREEPARRSKVIRQVKNGAVLQSVDMVGPWFKVRMGRERTGYIHTSQINLPPRTIEIDKQNINLRSGPGTNHSVVRNTSLKGSFPVLDMRYVDRRGLWYSFDYRGQPVWIYATLVKPRYSLPAVHFLAGLYRYYAGRFNNAATEFEQFVSHQDDRINVNLATGYQLLGASTVMGKSLALSRVKGIAAFNKAVSLTPYDPTAYNLRALANVALENNVALAAQDLKKSRELDKNNKGAAVLTRDLKVYVGKPTRDNRLIRDLLGPERSEVEELLERDNRVVIQPKPPTNLRIVE